VSDEGLPEIHVPDDLRGGIWVNHVLVTPSEDEITLDFVRMDPYASAPGAGVVVARVAGTHRCMTKFAANLNDALADLLRSELDSQDDAAN
jgi:hypothetical protein